MMAISKLYKNKYSTSISIQNLFNFQTFLPFSEFRYLMHNKCPYILESFYKFGELWDSEKIKRVRRIDMMRFEGKNNSK